MAATLAMTERRARRILGVAPQTDPAALKQAWRQALKTARPDQCGGNEARFREVIAAYRLLAGSGTGTPPVAAASARDLHVRDMLPLTRTEAASGGLRRVRLSSGQVLDVRLPGGLRPGQVVRLTGQGLRRGSATGDALLHVQVRHGPQTAARDLVRRFVEALAA